MSTVTVPKYSGVPDTRSRSTGLSIVQNAGYRPTPPKSMAMCGDSDTCAKSELNRLEPVVFPRLCAKTLTCAETSVREKTPILTVLYLLYCCAQAMDAVGGSWAGTLACRECRRKRLTGESFSGKQLQKMREGKLAEDKLKCKECTLKAATEEREK